MISKTDICHAEALDPGMGLWMLLRAKVQHRGVLAEQGGSLTGQGQGLGEPHEGDVIVILVIRVVAVDDDLGDRG